MILIYYSPGRGVTWFWTWTAFPLWALAGSDVIVDVVVSQLKRTGLEGWSGEICRVGQVLWCYGLGNLDGPLSPVHFVYEKTTFILRVSALCCLGPEVVIGVEPSVFA